MSAWVEARSDSFTARFAEEDAADAERVLASLEAAREGLERRLPGLPDELAVVMHDSELGLAAAVPALPLVRRLAAPAARRYLAGWATARELHVLAPRLLAGRASNVEGSLETLMLTPVALLCRVAVAAANPALPPPLTPRRLSAYRRWAWLAEGAAQHLSGQSAQMRPAILRRLREGRPPAFPPALPDAVLLGGSVLDLLAREEGEDAVVELVSRLHPQGPAAALRGVFRGRSLAHTEAAWRSSLERGGGPPPVAV